MASTPPDLLKPRKSPRQARSAATVDAIFEATIQVLLSEGAARLTTTRVAERAGVSVGTLYQYFPHKQALLYAVLKQHLEKVSDSVETACRHYEGLPLETMSDGLVAAFLDAKTGNIEAARALYLVSSELDTDGLLSDVTHRVGAAITRLLTSASDAAFSDIEAVGFTLCAALSGTVRAVLERGASPGALTILRSQLPVLCRAYLAAVH
jgi:AcrR family transcriptional regulator